MKIKVTVENATKISELLKKVNGERYCQYTYKTQEILDLARSAEITLEKLYLPKKYRKDATANATSCGNMPGAYKYSRKGNRITLTRGSAAWYITALATADIYPSVRRDRVHLTEKQKKIATKTMLDTATAL